MGVISGGKKACVCTIVPMFAIRWPVVLNISYPEVPGKLEVEATSGICYTNTTRYGNNLKYPQLIENTVQQSLVCS